MLALTQYVGDRYIASLSAQLQDISISPLQRLQRYYNESVNIDDLTDARFITKLVCELSERDERLRLAVRKILDSWQAMMEQCLIQAQQSGELASEYNPSELSEFLLVSWHGGILRTPVMQSCEPLRVFNRVAFGSLLLATSYKKQ